MFAAIIEAIMEILKAIPYFDKWFSKSEIDQEASGKQAVDKEHDSNAETKRPSDDFWKDHGGA